MKYTWGSIFLLLLAMTARCQDFGPPGVCCMPDELEGVLGETTVNGFSSNNGSETIMTMVAFSYDYPNRRVALQGYLGSPTVTKAIVYFLESPPRAYMVNGGSDPPACFIQTLGNLDLFPPCEPEDSIRVSKYYYGVTSSNRQDAFHYMHNMPNIIATCSVSNSCSWYVRIELRQSPQSGQTVGNTLHSYMNITQGISDDSVFMPPEGCSQPSPETDIDTTRLEYTMRGIFAYPTD